VSAGDLESEARPQDERKEVKRNVLLHKPFGKEIAGMAFETIERNLA
jgi:hypothetical protein